MEYFICILLLAIGIVLVVKGGDWFVSAASWMAEVSGIPTFIIGATIVSLATTLPEILVSSISAANGSTGLAIGNAVGSVNCNVALIMGISLIFMPAAFKRKDYAAKMILLVSAVAILWVFAFTNQEVTWWEGLIVLLVFIAFMIENVVSAKKHSILKPEDMPLPKELEYVQGLNKGYGMNFASDDTVKTITIKKSGKVIAKNEIGKNIFLFIIGVAGIVGGAELMCIYGEKFAQLLGVPDDIIGVTILAVGTSLPELVTTITAISKKKSELSVGNVIGANIIDISLILALCAFISSGSGAGPLPTAALNFQALNLDFPFCMAVCGFATLPALVMGKFKRWQGILLVASYITYITLLVLGTIGVIPLFANSAY